MYFVYFFLNTPENHFKWCYIDFFAYEMFLTGWDVYNHAAIIILHHKLLYKQKCFICPFGEASNILTVLNKKKKKKKKKIRLSVYWYKTSSDGKALILESLRVRITYSWPLLPSPLCKGCPRGVMVKAMDCRIVVSEFAMVWPNRESESLRYSDDRYALGN